jgi:hypothetical protein
MVIRKLVGERWAFPLVETVMLITLVVASYLGYQVQHQSECIRAYNEKTSQVAKARAEANDRQAAALADVMRSSLVSGEEYRRKAQAYLEAYDAGEKTKRDNPLVPPPSDFCG